jgi:TP901 family phage tail tape measure protein
VVGLAESKLFVVIGARTAGFEAKMRQVNKNIKEVEKSFKGIQQMGQRFADVGQKLALGLTLPIVGLAAAAVKTSMDLETAFTGVIKTVDATDEELAKLKQGFDDMAKRIPIATTELYGIGEAAGQLGIKKESILGFSEVMAKLGVTTNLSSQEAATALARFANITQTPQQNFDRLGATIVDLGNNLATTEAEITEMGLRLAGAGKQVKMTEAQILGFAGALSSVGIEAEMGGSAFSRVMLEMQNAVLSGNENLKIFASVAGMSSQEFAKAFKENAAGAIIAFIEGLGKVSASGQNVVPILDALGLSEIRVRDALLRAAGAGDLFRNSVELGTKAWQENIALNKEAEKRFATAASRFQLLKNRVGLLAGAFGGVLTPILLQFTKSFESIINSVSNMSESTKGIITAMLMLVAVVGPLTLLLGAAMKTITTWTVAVGLAKKAVDLWRVSTIAQTLATQGLATALKTTPLGWFMVTLAALGPVILSLLQKTNAMTTNLEDHIKAVNKEINTRQSSIKQLEAQRETIKTLGDQYANLKAKIDSGKLSDIEAQKAKAELKDLEEKMIPVIGKEGMQRIASASNTGKAVSFEMDAIQQRVKVEKEALKETMAAENARTLGLIYDVEQRIKALDTENKAYTFSAKLKEKLLRVGPLAKGTSYETKINDLRAKMYDEEREAERSRLQAYLKDLRSSLASIGGDSLLPTGLDYSKLNKDLIPEIQLPGATGSDKSIEAAEKVKTAWVGTSDALKNSLETLRTQHETAAIAAEMQGDKLAQLKLKGQQLNEELAKQKEIVARVKEEIAANTAAGVLEGETKEDLAKRTDELNKKLTDEEKAQADIEKQIYDTNQAIKTQAQDLRDLADEVTKVKKKYQDELAAALEDYQKKVKETNAKLAEDERKLTREYENQVDQRARALRDFVGLFDAVTSKEVSGTQLLENLRGQVKAFDDWQENIQALAARGVDQGLIAELREMGPKAGPEIAALNTLTDTELQEYVSLWRTKNEEARAEAVNQLQQQRVEMQQKLMEIRAAAT